jgi:mRNA interferase RelE/StbE
LDYEASWHEDALKDLKKIDKAAARKIIDKVKYYLVLNPVGLGKPLKGNFKGLLRYRIGDYRVVYVVDHEARLVRILAVNHRKSVYRMTRLPGDRSG